MQDLQIRLEAALADVGRATAALAGAEARAEEAAEDAAAARQDLAVAHAEGGAAERRLASVTAAAEVLCCAERDSPQLQPLKEKCHGPQLLCKSKGCKLLDTSACRCPDSL